MLGLVCRFGLTWADANALYFLKISNLWRSDRTCFYPYHSLSRWLMRKKRNSKNSNTLDATVFFHKQDNGQKTPQPWPFKQYEQLRERSGKHKKKILERLTKTLLDVTGNPRLFNPPGSERYFDKRSSTAHRAMANWPRAVKI